MERQTKRVFMVYSAQTGSAFLDTTDVDMVLEFTRRAGSCAVRHALFDKTAEDWTKFDQQAKADFHRILG